MSFKGKFGHGAATPDEEELETGEPLPDEGGAPTAGKIAGRKGKFGGGPPPMPKPDNPNDGVIVLASAKYFQRDPEPELRRENEQREAQRKAAEEAAREGTLEGSVFNGGVMGGVLAMVVAVGWFAVGLMNDYIFFYPPILFVIGLAALMKGLMKGE